MLKKALLFFCLFSVPCVSLCQNFGKNNSGLNYDKNVQFELFGHGGFYSVNYERFIINNTNLKTSVLIGTAYFPKNTEIINLW